MACKAWSGEDAFQLRNRLRPRPTLKVETNRAKMTEGGRGIQCLKFVYERGGASTDDAQGKNGTVQQRICRDGDAFFPVVVMKCLLQQIAPRGVAKEG